MELNHKKLGDGEPLIIMHGLFGSLDNWITVARTLAEEMSIYLIDLRNHGGSPHHEDWNYEVMAKDVLKLMDDQGLEKANVLGHSMGGKVAMFLAHQAPERISRLIVVDMAPRAYPVHHQSVLKAYRAVPIDEIENREEAEESMKPIIKDAGTRQFLLKNLSRKEGGKGFSWKMNLKVIEEKIEEVGAPIPNDTKLERPTLFIGGEKSDYIQDKDKEEIKKHFPQSQVIHLKGAGHWVHAEQPEALILTLKEFFKRN